MAARLERRKSGLPDLRIHMPISGKPEIGRAAQVAASILPASARYASYGGQVRRAEAP